MTEPLQLAKPPDLSRVETGAVRFGDDWPGMFLRGDDAMMVAISIRHALDILPEEKDSVLQMIYRGVLNGLADRIERDVIVKPKETK